MLRDRGERGGKGGRRGGKEPLLTTGSRSGDGLERASRLEMSVLSSGTITPADNIRHGAFDYYCDHVAATDVSSLIRRTV